MTAREFLDQYKEAERVARLYREAYETELQRIDAIGSPLGDGTPHGGQISRTVENRAVRLAEKAKEWKLAELEAQEVKDRVTEVVMQVKGAKGAVLFERYVNLKKWDNVAKTLHYTPRHCRNLHDEALEAVEAIIS